MHTATTSPMQQLTNYARFELIKVHFLPYIHTYIGQLPVAIRVCVCIIKGVVD